MISFRRSRKYSTHFILAVKKLTFNDKYLIFIFIICILWSDLYVDTYRLESVVNHACWNLTYFQHTWGPSARWRGDPAASDCCQTLSTESLENLWCLDHTAAKDKIQTKQKYQGHAILMSSHNPRVLFIWL